MTKTLTPDEQYDELSDRLVTIYAIECENPECGKGRGAHEGVKCSESFDNEPQAQFVDRLLDEGWQMHKNRLLCCRCATEKKLNPVLVT